MEEKHSEELFTSIASLWNTSNYPIILTNGTQRDEIEYQMPLETVLKLSLACVGTPANMLVILLSGRLIRHSLKSHNVLTMLLGIADILYLLSILIAQKEVFGVIGFEGSLFNCRIIMFITMFSSLSSSWLIVLISCERFICVKWPIKMHLNHDNYKKRSLCMLVITLMILAGIASVQFMFGHVEDSNNAKRCYAAAIDDERGLLFEIVIMSLYGLIPTVPVIFFNLSILQILVKHNKNKGHCLSEQSAENRPQTLKSNTCVAVTVLSVSFMFVLCRSPLCIIFWVGLIFKRFTSSYLFFNKTVYSIVFIVDLLDHTWNLAVYIFSSSIFRSELYNIVRCNKESSHP